MNFIDYVEAHFIYLIRSNITIGMAGVVNDHHTIARLTMYEYI